VQVQKCERPPFLFRIVEAFSLAFNSMTFRLNFVRRIPVAQKVKTGSTQTISQTEW
jgi:hypothetical protein